MLALADDSYAEYSLAPQKWPLLPLPKNMIYVPLYRQGLAPTLRAISQQASFRLILFAETDYSCGPSSALALLRYWAWEQYKDVTEQELYGPMNCSSQNGTDPGPIAAYFVNYAHIEATYVNGNSTVDLHDLERAIDDGKPPIVDLQAWRVNNTVDWKTDWGDGHYNVLVGHDHDNLFFMDPSTGGRYAYIPKGQFVTRWHDIVGIYNTHAWHMVVFVEGTGNPHPKHPKHDTSSYED
jgi:predicted double-glycine peptidase